MSYRRSLGALLVAVLMTAISAWGWSVAQGRFDHKAHETLFSSCDGCHSVEPAAVTFPEPSLCQGCHNGQIAPPVAWEGPSRVANKFGFNHAEYREQTGELECAECHQAAGGGVMDVRRSPASHTPFFAEDHRVLGAAAGSECSVCHNRDQRCQGCHIGSQSFDSPSREQGNYHPADFMQQHSAAAWNREVECASCHNTEVYCRSCHMELGRASGGRTITGYHNENPDFVFGHGKAARQSLESCASCHAQSDCLQCHSATEGRNINPHGPGFDAKKLRDKNRELCLFCHFSGQVGG